MVGFDVHQTARYTDFALAEGRTHGQLTSIQEADEVVVVRQDIKRAGSILTRQAIGIFIKVHLER